MQVIGGEFLYAAAWPLCLIGFDPVLGLGPGEPMLAGMVVLAAVTVVLTTCARPHMIHIILGRSISSLFKGTGGLPGVNSIGMLVLRLFAQMLGALLGRGALRELYPGALPAVVDELRDYAESLSIAWYLALQVLVYALTVAAASAGDDREWWARTGNLVPVAMFPVWCPSFASTGLLVLVDAFGVPHYKSLLLMVGVHACAALTAELFLEALKMNSARIR